MIELARPWALALLLLPALLVFLRRRRGEEAGASLRHACLGMLPVTGGGARVRWGRYLGWAGPAALVLLAVAVAGPRSTRTSETVSGRGVDIVVALDISGSMRALDFQPRDRLGVAKQVIRDFVDGRPHDRVGLVLFAARAFTQCPLTLDRDVLRGFLDEVEVGLIDDGTAIGLGLATAVARLRESEADSRVVILLTDGLNNVPTLEPETAADLARSLGVRVYTIGVGRDGFAPYPVDDPVFGRRMRQIETRIDMDLLRRLAGTTGGAAYRAEDPDALARIFATIDHLERSEYQTVVSSWHRELAGWLVAPALALLALQALLGSTWLRRLP